LYDILENPPVDKVVDCRFEVRQYDAGENRLVYFYIDEWANLYMTKAIAGASSITGTSTLTDIPN
jgi:hypothetical protein